ncbi:hypothetical protein HGM15179_009038 [Zosterops borbonicus]|uniref:Uncharacterized protein n=1 Tax=Zosterops borbonicus TaxID=364589 RepID=A0A8K1LKY9_9PASS|nr:hypothetical protein HGM15179_009038 [Zosterops borbonicus]
MAADSCPCKLFTSLHDYVQQGNFQYDEILEVLQERTPKELPVPISGPRDLSKSAGLQALALCVLFAGEDKGFEKIKTSGLATNNSDHYLNIVLARMLG